MSLVIRQADLKDPNQQQAVLALTSAYARDVWGNNGPLAPDVLERLIPALQAHPTTVILLAWDGDRPVGIATCFLGFSTFLAKPLLNVHDLAVLPEDRGRGIARELLRAVEREARARGCGRVTLEVLERNERARRLYEAAGFRMTHDADPGKNLFFTKVLAEPAQQKD